MEKTYLTANQFQQDSISLATKALKNYKPDLILALWRGGATPAIILTEVFEYIYNQEVESNIVKISHYHNLEKRVAVANPINIPNIEHKNHILLVDDVFDTGNSIKEAFNLLTLITKAEIKVATVYYKPENNQTNLKPDFFYKTIDSWLVFPHEINGLSKEELLHKPDFF